ncbi:MAG: glucose-6-phosphate isomerase [Lachnospiraceae bacterium]|jgi:glucose-6-phosphate isomerase|nr:glucose-6-phosphate isomerase [Lachnospiraceae bacterium]MCX4316668.1 glucose-6-phosphate isomerase [Lachnospiraceae bacterium]
MIRFVTHNLSGEDHASLQAMLRENKEKLREAQAGEACYADNQGWLAVEEWAGEERLRKIKTLAEEIRAKAEVFVLIGVGGSNNAARSVIEALREDGENPEIIYAGNTLSPYALKQMLKRLEGKSVYINCIAKNFETLEPGASFRILRQYLYRTYGADAPGRILATGTVGSSLERLCRENGYRFLEFPQNIGGRYTALSNVGLLPMAVAGVDIDRLAAGAREMERQLRDKKQREEEHIAYQYACLRNFYYRKGYRVELLAGFEPQLRYFYKWWIQLFAESEGKENKGLLPVSAEFSEELHAVGQFIQDGSPILLETFLHIQKQQASLVVEPDSLADYFDYLDGKDFQKINEAAYQATVAAHSQKLPCLTLEVGALDAYHFGGLFYFFEFACYLSCKLMGVNPFDQPGVEAYKSWMFEALGKAEKKGE